MIDGVSAGGFAYRVDERVFSDYDFLDLLTQMQRDDSNASLVFRLTEMLLGSEQLGTLKDFVREDGFVSAEAVFAVVREILEAHQPKK